MENIQLAKNIVNALLGDIHTTGSEFDKFKIKNQEDFHSFITSILVELQEEARIHPATKKQEISRMKARDYLAFLNEETEEFTDD